MSDDNLHREHHMSSFISPNSTHGWNFYLHSWQSTVHATYCVFHFNSVSAATWHGGLLLIPSLAANTSCRYSPNCLQRPHALRLIQDIGSMQGSVCQTKEKQHRRYESSAWSVWTFQHTGQGSGTTAMTMHSLLPHVATVNNPRRRATKGD